MHYVADSLVTVVNDIENVGGTCFQTFCAITHRSLDIHPCQYLFNYQLFHNKLSPLESLTQVVDIERNAVESLGSQVQMLNTQLHFIKETNNLDNLAEYKIPTSGSNESREATAEVDHPALPPPSASEPMSIFERLKTME